MTKKPKINSKQPPKKYNLIVILLPILTLLAGFLIAGTLWYPGPQELATIEQKEIAKQQIKQKILNNQDLNCSINPYQQTSVENAAEITINGFADRAVVRGCWGKDFLFYKNQAGSWSLSNVGLILDFEHNSKWAYECKIQDIVQLSKTSLSENFSIDDFNYRECKEIDNL